MVSKEGRAIFGRLAATTTWLIAVQASRKERKWGTTQSDEEEREGKRDHMNRQEDRTDEGMIFFISYVHAIVLTMKSESGLWCKIHKRVSRLTNDDKDRSHREA